MLDCLHPSIALKEDFMLPNKISIVKLAQDLFISEQCLNEFIEHHSPLTTELGLKLARYFNTPEGYWINLQTRYDVVKYKESFEMELNNIQSVYIADNSEVKLCLAPEIQLLSPPNDIVELFKVISNKQLSLITVSDVCNAKYVDILKYYCGDKYEHLLHILCEINKSKDILLILSEYKNNNQILKDDYDFYSWLIGFVNYIDSKDIISALDYVHCINTIDSYINFDTELRFNKACDAYTTYENPIFLLENISLILETPYHKVPAAVRSYFIKIGQNFSTIKDQLKKQTKRDIGINIYECLSFPESAAILNKFSTDNEYLQYIDMYISEMTKRCKKDGNLQNKVRHNKIIELILDTLKKNGKEIHKKTLISHMRNIINKDTTPAHYKMTILPYKHFFVPSATDTSNVTKV